MVVSDDVGYPQDSVLLFPGARRALLTNLLGCLHCSLESGSAQALLQPGGAQLRPVGQVPHGFAKDVTGIL